MGIFDPIRKALFGESSSIVGKTPTLKNRTREYGASGTENFHGFITQDYLPQFQGESAIDTYEEMRRSDATVNAVLNAMKLPILSADRRIESADSKDTKANDIAEFVRVALFEKLYPGLDSVLREGLCYFDFGFYYFEKVYKIEDGRVFLARLAPRPPSAHYKWLMDSDVNTPGVTQMLPTTQPGDTNENRYREIPMWKLVLFSYNKEGDNYEGVSVLRPAYKHWYFKNVLYRLDGIRFERGAGVLNIGLPSGSTDADIANAEQLGKNFKLNEQGFILRPNKDWDVTLLTEGFSDQSQALMESVKHHDRMIVVNMLAHFLDLGSSSTGSYALSRDQSDFFSLSLRSQAKYIADVINYSIIKELVDLNFGPQEEYPKFCFGEIGSVDYKEMSDALEKLVNANLIKVDPELKVWAHKTFGLPEKSIDDFEDESEEEGIAAKPKAKESTKGIPDEADDEEEVDEEDIAEEEDDDAEVKAAEKKRALTLAEKRIQFADIDKGLDDQSDEIEEILANATEAQKRDLFAKLGRAAEGDNLGAVDNLSLLSVAGLVAALREAIKKSLEMGKRNAAKEIGVTVPATSAYTNKVLGLKLDLSLKQRSDRVLTAIKNRMVDWLNNDVGKAAIIAEAERVFDALMEVENARMVGSLPMDAMNEGRASVFDTNPIKVYGLQRSEILDTVTCPMCLTVDGRVLSKNDPFTKVNQIHTNCRGLWAAILQTDAELPPIKQLPKSIKNKFQTADGVPSTNNFEQPKKVIVRKGSRLEKKVEDGIVEV